MPTRFSEIPTEVTVRIREPAVIAIAITQRRTVNSSRTTAPFCIRVAMSRIVEI
jgi:hypothetical protein